MISITELTELKMYFWNEQPIIVEIKAREKMFTKIDCGQLFKRRNMSKVSHISADKSKFGLAIEVSVIPFLFECSTKIPDGDTTTDSRHSSLPCSRSAWVVIVKMKVNFLIFHSWTHNFIFSPSFVIYEDNCCINVNNKLTFNK